METKSLEIMVQHVVGQAAALKNKHVKEKETPVNYACIFSQSKAEYDGLVGTTRDIGKVIKETPTGLLFNIRPLTTVSGELRLLKIRLPDKTRPEMGDADFTVRDFKAFKEKYLTKEGFKLIRRSDFEMVELVDPGFNVRAYFSNPPLDKQLGIK